MRRPDVLIVGAGIAGCSSAAHLLRADPSLQVLLLDGHHVGAGSSSRSTAAFRHQWSVPAHVTFSRYSSQEYDALTERGHPIGFQRNGYLFLFTDPDRLASAADRVARGRALGVEDVRVLDPAGVASEVPCGRYLASGKIAGATWGPADGFLDPLSAAQAYLEEAREAGLEYRTAAEAVGLVRSGGARVLGVLLADGERVATGRVLLCAGVWGVPFMAREGLRLPIRPAKRYLYHTRPVEGADVSAWPMTIGPSGAHCRPAEGNTLMMAWERRPDPLAEDTSEDSLWERQDEIEAGFGLEADGYGVEILTELADVIPFFQEGVGLSRATCGWYAVTADHKAILGEDPRLMGLFHATGFSGHGIMHGPATGRIMADLLLEGSEPLVPAAEINAGFGLTPLLEGRLREPVEDMVL